jgi:hypothetical protein
VGEGADGEAAGGGGEVADAGGDGVGFVGEVSAKNFVGPFSAEDDGGLAAAHLGEEPDGEGAGVGGGFVGEPGELFDGSGEVEVGAEVELLVIGSVAVDDLLDVGRLVEAAAGEGDGKGVEAGGGGLGGVVEDGGGVETSGEPEAEGHVGHELLFDGLLEEGVELMFGVVQGDAVVGLHGREMPVGGGGDFSVLPGEPFSGRKFLDAVDQSPGAGNVVEGEVSVEAVEGKPARDLGMDEDAFKFGGEQEVSVAMGEVEGLDAEAIAGEDEALGGFCPEADGEHAAEAGETFDIPLQESVEDGLGIAVGREGVAEGLEFAAEVEVVVDFSVEDDDGVSVGGVDGLIAGVEVENF